MTFIFYTVRQLNSQYNALQSKPRLHYKKQPHKKTDGYMEELVKLTQPQQAYA